MPKYHVTITRTEYFLIDTDSADTAVDAAFDEAGSSLVCPYPYNVRTDGEVQTYGTILEHDETTIDHTVEEEESNPVH